MIIQKLLNNLKELEQESEIQIKGLRNNADYIINNNGSIEELHNQVDKIIKQLCG